MFLTCLKIIRDAVKKTVWTELEKIYRLYKYTYNIKPNPEVERIHSNSYGAL